MMNAIEFQSFDTEIFGVPFYRIKHAASDRLESELNRIMEKSPVIIDVKIEADNRMLDRYFQKIGFRKICTQVEFVKFPLKCDAVAGVTFSDRFTLPDDILRQYAANRIYDRFDLDPFIADEKKNKLYFTWLKNSFANPSINIAYINENFCSFKEKNNEIYIELLMVLVKRKKMGTLLLHAVENYAANSNVTRIGIITECENKPAVNLYLKNNFKIVRFLTCFHYVRL